GGEVDGGAGGPEVGPVIGGGNEGTLGISTGHAAFFNDRNLCALHAVGYGVQRRMTAGFDLDAPAPPFELAVQDAGPQVEGLLDALDVFGLVDGEANAAEIAAVGVFAEPVEKRRLAGGSGGVADFAAVGIVLGEAKVAGRAAGR